MKGHLILIFLFFLLSKTFCKSAKTYYSFRQALTDSIRVKKLSLSGDSLSRFSPEILKLNNLEEVVFESSKTFNIDYAIPILAKLKNLKKLWISDIKVLDLKGISGLNNLEELSLDNVGIAILPDEISHLKKLREIDLDENPQLNIEQAFSVLSKIGALKVLWLEKNGLSTLPDNISELKTLEDLWLNGNEFTEVPSSIKKLKIKYVSFFDNKIEHLNLNKGDLANLNNINLCYNNFKVFPAAELSLLLKLDTIKMWYANVRFIPKQIADIKKLKALNLEYNSISNLPPEMAELKDLHILELTGNKLTTDGIRCVYQLRNLKTLQLYRNNIKNISPKIENLKSLTDLSICENPLIKIPQSLSKLKKLQKIQLGYYDKFNWAQAIDIIGKLPDLKYVGLFKMKLSKMPDGFKKLSSVKEFWMNWNVFDKAEQERIQALTPNAKFVFN
jgi:Leucine-rich repeat (LRR) protein